MKRVYIVTVITAILVVFAGIFIQKNNVSNAKDHIKVGFIYVGDKSNAYTDNFIEAQDMIESTFGDSVEIVPMYNISEANIEIALDEMLTQDCSIIFATSYGYETAVKNAAIEHPEIQFCMATGDNAKEDPEISNYHTYMGRIYEGRYIAGIVAGRKLKEMIDNQEISSEEAKIGYVGAFPYAEVISGYTAFYLGVASVVPEVTMEVKYANSWGDYVAEKSIAKELIDDGCVIISQHSDTYGPAVACEEANATHKVYHVGYNKNMSDLAPTSSLISSKINWAPYEVAAVQAVLDGKDIEDDMDADVNGYDSCAGFDCGWVSMTRLNSTIAAQGTASAIEEAISEFKSHNIDVFKGDYTGTNPYDANDTIDLSDGYTENASQSAPSFGYVLDDVITILP